MRSSGCVCVCVLLGVCVCCLTEWKQSIQPSRHPIGPPIPASAASHTSTSQPLPGMWVRGWAERGPGRPIRPGPVTNPNPQSLTGQSPLSSAHVPRLRHHTVNFHLPAEIPELKQEAIVQVDRRRPRPAALTAAHRRKKHTSTHRITRGQRAHTELLINKRSVLQND